MCLGERSSRVYRRPRVRMGARLFAGERVHRQQHLRARERRWKVYMKEEWRKETTKPEAIGESAEKVEEEEEKKNKRKSSRLDWWK